MVIFLLSNYNYLVTVLHNIYLFFKGEGGVGKTFLIKVLSQWTEYILQKPGDISTYPKVIRLAATGNAAYLIGNRIP